MPALPVLSAGRKTDPDAKGHLAFAQLPKLVKTPRHALPAAGNTADAGEGNDSDSSYDDNDSYNNDSDAPLVGDE